MGQGPLPLPSQNDLTHPSPPSILPTTPSPHQHPLLTTMEKGGNKGAGLAGSSESNLDRRERLRKLAMESIDLAKDPYILRNHLGSLECRLCLTIHTNEGSYLAHTQGKKHQTNLARRAAKEAKETAMREQREMGLLTMGPGGMGMDTAPKKSFVKIGRPGYKITKVREPAPITSEGYYDTSARPPRIGLLFQIQYPEIKEGVKPLYRFMSTFEQRVEPQNRAWQYLVVAAEPYESVGFKLQSREIERGDGEEGDEGVGGGEPPTWSHWDGDTRTYSE